MAPRHPGSSGVPRAPRVTLGRHAISCLRGLGASWPSSRAGFETLGLFLSDVTGIQLCRLEPPSSTVCAGGCPVPATGAGVGKGQRGHLLCLGHLSLLCCGHCHLCAMVSITAVPLSSSLLCHGHPHCCAVSLSLLCHSHCHCCARVTILTVSRSLLPSAIHSVHPTIPISQTPTSIPFLHHPHVQATCPGATVAPSQSHIPAISPSSRSPAVFALAPARPGRV